jgi:ribosomal protein L11 methyltransferase
MNYLVFTFHTNPRTETAEDVLAAVLADVGFETFINDEQEAALTAYIQTALFDESALTAALADFPMPDVQVNYTYTEAEDRDWNEEWEQHYFQPIVIDGRCVVHSTFHSDYPRAEYDITINPQMAFGTGHHETTGLIIRALLDADLRGKRVLDMGCGTSILAILCRMKGAAECLAIDIDEWCVRNSLENIALNQLTGITVQQGDASALKGVGMFDVIIANINRNILLADMHHYVDCMTSGASLFLSGFYTEDIPLLQQEATRCGLSYIGSAEQNHWAMAHFIRN